MSSPGRSDPLPVAVYAAVRATFGAGDDSRRILRVVALDGAFRIIGVMLDGAWEEDGSIQKGDHIIAVNGVLTEGKTFDEVHEMMTTSVDMAVLRLKPDASDLPPSAAKMRVGPTVASTNNNNYDELVDIVGATDNIVTDEDAVQAAHRFVKLQNDGGGLGIKIRRDKSGAFVVFGMRVNGPAWTSGVVQGDCIVAVNQTAVANQTAFAVSELLLSSSTTELFLVSA